MLHCPSPLCSDPSLFQTHSCSDALAIDCATAYFRTPDSGSHEPCFLLPAHSAMTSRGYNLRSRIVSCGTSQVRPSQSLFDFMCIGFRVVCHRQDGTRVDADAAFWATRLIIVLERRALRVQLADRGLRICRCHIIFVHDDERFWRDVRRLNYLLARCSISPDTAPQLRLAL